MFHNIAMRTAVYPGSFDPPTVGHVDVMRRAARLFDKLIVAVGRSAAKGNLFSVEERLEMLCELTDKLENVEVQSFSGLLVGFAAQSGATALVRGLRALSDFENEFQMALTNRRLAPEIETVFLMTSPEHMFISSSIVREVASLGGDITNLVPPLVARHLLAKQA